MNGFLRAVFRFFGPRRRFSFRWMTLFTVLLILGKAQAAAEGARMTGYYLLVLALVEAGHWALAKWFFPGMERELIVSPLCGPAPVPANPSLKGFAAALGPPLVLGGAAAALLYGGITPPRGLDLLRLMLVVCAVRLLPFFPMDGHVVLSAAVRRTNLYWSRPAWREYVSAAGGVLVAAAGVVFDPLDAGIVLLPGGISILLENLYMLRLRRRPTRTGPTGSPSAARADPGDKARLDAILEKISREGMTALTPEEEEFLQGMSGRFRRKP
ncbi:MAG: hypothetical protein JW909_03590 [Planctomycetes bacterium]|nr:hypothetical protein [Planctomycetota bacterium]